jgi:hypothetical protein
METYTTKDELIYILKKVVNVPYEDKEPSLILAEIREIIGYNIPAFSNIKTELD